MYKFTQPRRVFALFIGLISISISLFLISQRQPTALAAPRTVPAADLPVYDDGLAAAWQDWSWSTTVNFATNSPTHGGTAAIAITYNQAWAGFSLRAPVPIDTSPYTAVTFWVHGGAAGTRQLTLFTQQSDNTGNSSTVNVDAPAGGWTPITISLDALGNPSTIARINLQDRSNSVQPTFYVDDLRLVGSATVPTASTATPTPLPAIDHTIRIHADGAALTLDPRVLGTNLPAWLNPTRLANTTFRARTAASGVTVIRMPGGSWSNHYGWLSCEMGQNQTNAFPCGDNWASWVAKPTDFINFLKATGKAGMWVVSNNATPQEAAAAVAFFNATTTDTTVIGVDNKGFDWKTAGDWAQLRTDHGNPQPLGIKLWSVGNEVYGGTPASGGAQCQAWGWEDVWSCDGTEYAHGARSYAGYIAFRTAMRAVDPTIQVGAVGVTPASDYTSWGNKVLAAAGASMDFYDIHEYGFFTAPTNQAAVLALPQSDWPAIMDDVRNAFTSQVGGRAIPVGVTEYNLFATQENDNQQLMTRAVGALYIADTLGQMIQQGVVMANQWGLANGRAGNGTEYSLLHEDNNYYRSPQYYVFPLWSRFGNQMLPVTSSFNAATQLSVYGGRIDGATYSLLAINKSEQALTTNLTIDSEGKTFAITGGTVDIVSATNLSAQAVTYNNVSDPADDLSDAPALPLGATGSALTYTFAANSITLLRLQVDSQGPNTPATPAVVPTVPPHNTPNAALNEAVFLPLVTQ